MGVRLEIDVVAVVVVEGNEFCKGRDICFLALGGNAGNRSEFDETLDRVSSLDVLLLSRKFLEKELF